MGLYLFLAIEAVCTGMVVWGVVTFVSRLRRQRARRALASQRLDERDIAIEASLTRQTPPGTERRFNTMPPPVEHRAADRNDSTSAATSIDPTGWATLQPAPSTITFYDAPADTRPDPCPDPAPTSSPTSSPSHDSWSSPSTSDYSGGYSGGSDPGGSFSASCD